MERTKIYNWGRALTQERELKKFQRNSPHAAENGEEAAQKKN